jgi:hypothetical protein
VNLNLLQPMVIYNLEALTLSDIVANTQSSNAEKGTLGVISQEVRFFTTSIEFLDPKPANKPVKRKS